MAGLWTVSTRQRETVPRRLLGTTARVSGGGRHLPGRLVSHMIDARYGADRSKSLCDLYVAPMLFARRSRLPLVARIRNFVWPSAGFRRAIAYLAKRVARLRASPHAIAAGFASGAAASCFPLIGLHFLLSFALAWCLRGSMVAAALGTAVGNPLTFPILFAAAYRLGAAIRGEEAALPGAIDQAGSELAAEGIFSGSLEHAWPLFTTTMIGAAPIALATFAAFYMLVRWSTARVQAARRDRLASKALRGRTA